MTGAEVRETHTAVVFFVGDRAYKLKKPVDLGFVDFRDRAARERACRAEVRLNRRFAPDVYLGVADVTGPDGDLCDHLVVMRRLPAERRLAALVRAGEPVDDALRATAKLLASWHARAPRGPEITADGGRDALRARWEQGFAQVRLDGQNEIEERVHRFLAGRADLFAAREDRIVDGHGDLLADDVFCLDDGPRVLDCLEFDADLRHLDGLDDAAFLAMDLERLGAPEEARKFVGWYAEFAADPAPPSLLHHYVAYRAFVRARVACLRAAQGAPDPGADALAGLALRHLRAGAVTVVLVGGLPGTGKSTLAGGLAARLGATVLGSDRVRKELAGLTPETSAAAPYATGLYAPEHTRRTYAELAGRAARLLRRGETVVLDASWTSAEHRALAAEAAQREHADLVAIECRAPGDVTAARLRNRGPGASDADRDTARSMAGRADPWPEAVPLDTTGPALDRALEIVRARAR
ncbi:2-phosphoglycerate kinase [Actinomadura rubteroloni]|uniref:2-phosphoglycerate kinase n=1 Tax=Actinomadura rubteroloni TaxID=1926885 RepID=A0A2P4URX4_9ACTN|nr:bifunctional aminoglycoside phosphotransferase/ATP-binding protein [Actinomadura rubteroloni]POM27797.1 2-phosphoglycerate kinase [Actinomadura rubteroloni]